MGKSALLAVILALSNSAASCAEDAGKAEVPYAKEPIVVRGPAMFFGGALSVPGSIIGAVLVCPTLWIAKHDKPEERAYKPCVKGMGADSFYAGEAIGGFPFFIVKRIAWDLPHHAIKGSAEKPRTGTMKDGKPVWDPPE